MAKNYISVASITPDKSNILFRIATDLVNQSSRNIFLTGKAGTGKTTFLKYIRENCSKQMVVAAPTGVAAINAGGVTLHSLFQLPFSPYIPGGGGQNDQSVNRHNLLSRLRMTNEKKKLIREMELLVIDEISMVRSDTLDAVDAVLRHVRGRQSEIFGGVQVLFIGDMFQLPPVIKDQEWRLLSDHYSGPYFFDSYVIREEQPLYIEFDKIYRQSDERFIRVLNQVRNNELDEEGLNILEARFQPGFRRTKNDGFIILTTHNETVRQINTEKLEQLNGQVYSFKADIEDDFPSSAFPADEILNLKLGAQVMFIKNDPDRNKRYYNGKIGTVSKVAEEKIYVQCKDEPGEIEVKKEKWENIRYDLDNATRQIDPKLLGSFSQYPLRLAWAITIHKSQGLTFEKAIIDAGNSFAAGQVYVALSRCTNLEGMILQSRIRSGHMFTDQRIVAFSRSNSSANELEKELAMARRDYQLHLLSATFDFKKAIQASNELELYMMEHKSSFNPEVWKWIDSIKEKLVLLQEMADKFHVWLRAQFQQAGLPEDNSVLRERTARASDHFVKELVSLMDLVLQSPGITDSWIHAKEYNEGAKEIFAELSLKRFLLAEQEDKLDIASWLILKKRFRMPSFTVNAYAGLAKQKITSPHPLLYQQLRKLRDAICEKDDQPIYMVASGKALDEMVSYLPQTSEELEQVSGFGKVKVERYGRQFLDIIQPYCREYSLTSSIREKVPKRVKKEKKEGANDTKNKTFTLYKEGKTITEIAGLRQLAPSTIEGHLTHYIEKGEIDIHELVSKEKLLRIEPVLRNMETTGLNSIKEQLGDTVSFNEIRWVIASGLFRKPANTE